MEFVKNKQDDFAEEGKILFKEGAVRLIQKEFKDG